MVVSIGTIQEINHQLNKDRLKNYIGLPNVIVVNFV